MPRQFYVVICLMAASLPAFADECAGWQSQHPEWIWCDSFESANALNQYEDRKTTEESPQGMDLSGDAAFDGQNSLRQVYSAGQVSAGWIIKIADFPDNLFVRFYHKFNDGYSQFPPKMARVGFRDHSTWTETMRVHLWITEKDGHNVLIADTLARDSSQSNGSGWLGVAYSDHYLDASENVDRWVAYEMQIKLNTPCESDGIYRVWVDDRLVIERENVDLRGCETYGTNEVMLDTYWNDGATGQLARYYDNFVISTARIGKMSLTSPPKAPELSIN